MLQGDAGVLTPTIGSREAWMARRAISTRINSNQLAQFTRDEFTKVLRDHEIEIRMNGRGLWWTLSTNGSTCA
jgi:transposase InsO family protein